MCHSVALLEISRALCWRCGRWPEILALHNNSLTGSIPSGVWKFEKLEYLDLFMNNFTGNLVMDGFAAVSLECISLSKNKLIGTNPKVFGCLENLIYLFFGVLPPELRKHSSSLSYVLVDDNELTGEIPEGLCDGGQLKHFTASVDLANCNILQQPVLHSNQLSGGIS
jgi:kinase